MKLIVWGFRFIIEGLFAIAVLATVLLVAVVVVRNQNNGGDAVTTFGLVAAGLGIMAFTFMTLGAAATLVSINDRLCELVVLQRDEHVRSARRHEQAVRHHEERIAAEDSRQRALSEREVEGGPAA